MVAYVVWRFMNDRKPFIMIPIAVLIFMFCFAPASALAFRLALMLLPSLLLPGVMELAFASGVAGLFMCYGLLWVVSMIYERISRALYPHYVAYLQSKW